MIYIKQDITKIKRGIIVHGVNCLGIMGSGVALAIKRAMPIAYERYKEIANPRMLGLTQIVNIEDQLYVANCFTQINFGTDSRKKYADIDAVKNCLESCYEFAQLMNLPLCSVKIASLRGGLDWDSEVEPIFLELNNREEYSSVDVAIYYI